MSAQDALNNLATLLRRQLEDSFASTSGGSGSKRPSSDTDGGVVVVRAAGPHFRAGGARDRRWVEHEAVVTDRLDSVESRLAEYRHRCEETHATLNELEQTHDEALERLLARVNEQAKALSEATAAKAEPVAPAGMVERTVTGLLDVVKADHAAAISALPYLAMLVSRPADDAGPGPVEEVARLIVDRALSSPVRANSHARLCRDLAKLVPPSVRVTRQGGFLLSGPAAFHKLVNDGCLQGFVTAPNKVHAAAFVAELFVRAVATKQTVHAVLVQLLVEASAGDDQSTTAAYQVLAKVGQKLDVTEDKALMDAHFARLKGAEVSLALWNKIGALIELRNKGWEEKESTTAVSVVSTSSVTSAV